MSTSEGNALPAFILSSELDADSHEHSGAVDLTQAIWRKSSWSSYNGNCVEVAELRGRGLIAVRDTKSAGLGPVLLFEGAAWRSFIDAVRNGAIPR